MKEIGKGGVMEQVRLHLGKKPDLVLFRNQAGRVEIRGQWQTYGLHNGASDLVGLLAPSGRFFAIELKSPSGKVGEEQARFLELIEKFGGYACVVSGVVGAEAHYLAAGGRYPQQEKK